MTKQVVYPNFVTRIFASSLDLFLITTIVTPVLQFFSLKLFTWNFQDYIIRYGVNINHPNAITVAMRSPDFVEYATFERFATYIGVMLFLQCALFSGYFVYFWHKMGWTPGKYILGLRVVDAETLVKPSIYQCVKRFLWYPFAFISIWFIMFTQKRQGLHDKIAGTMVTKK